MLFWSVKSPKGLTDHFYGCEKGDKTFWFEVYVYIKESAFTGVKRDAKFKTRYVKVVPIEGKRKGHLFRVVYKRVRVWTSGRNLPV